jgi:hypothetical protein
MRLALVLAAAALALASCGSSEQRALAPAGATAPRSVAPSRISIGATSQFDLAHRGTIAVRVRVPHGRRPAIRVSLVPAGRRAVLAAAPVAARPTTVRRLRVPVRAAAARAAGGCRSVRITVTVAERGGAVLARRSTTLAADAPACGRFFNPKSIWNAPIAPDAAPDRDSAAMVADLRAQVQSGFDRHFPPTINTVTYSSPVYTVTAGQARVPVALVGSRRQWGGKLARQLGAGVPIPPGARAAWGGDHHMVVWQPATDTMWELWGAEPADGRWEVDWGGVMRHVSRSPGYFSDSSGIQPGATATSLPLAGGLITQADVARGRIDHALAMAIPRSRSGVWSLPAQRTDGNVKSPTAIPAGARFRLDPRLDVDALGLPPFTAMMAKAAQRYGIYVRDTSPTVTFYAQDPVTMGANPWPGAIKPSSAEVLRRFPWERLEVMPLDLRTYSNQRVSR